METKATLSYLAAALAMLALVGLAPFFFAAGLVAPLWAVVGFIAVWIALFVLGCVWFRRKPLRTLPLPLVAAAIWLVGMNAGEAWLGWTG